MFFVIIISLDNFRCINLFVTTQDLLSKTRKFHIISMKVLKKSNVPSTLCIRRNQKTLNLKDDSKMNMRGGCVPFTCKTRYQLMWSFLSIFLSSGVMNRQRNRLIVVLLLSFYRFLPFFVCTKHVYDIICVCKFAISI